MNTVTSKKSFSYTKKSNSAKFVYLLFLVIGLYSCVDTKKPINDVYTNTLNEFYSNQIESLKHYESISLKSNPVFLKELSTHVIPKWEKNVSLLEELNAIEGFKIEKENFIKGVLNYSKLRLELFQLVKKAVSEDTNEYNDQINALNSKINHEIDINEKYLNSNL